MKYTRILQSALFFSALAVAQAPFQNISHEFWAARTAMAGHSNWYEFLPKTAVPVTCNPSVSRCSASGYQFVGGESARFYSQGTAPAGLYTMYGGSEAWYVICDLQGTTFTLRENTCGGTVVPFTTSGTGKQNVLVNIGKTTYFTSVTGFPAGTVLNWYYMNSGGISSVLNQVNGIPWRSDTLNGAREPGLP